MNTATRQVMGDIKELQGMRKEISEMISGLLELLKPGDFNCSPESYHTIARVETLVLEWVVTLHNGRFDFEIWDNSTLVYSHDDKEAVSIPFEYVKSAREGLDTVVENIVQDHPVITERLRAATVPVVDLCV